jgi:hypothetical protein
MSKKRLMVAEFTIRLPFMTELTDEKKSALYREALGHLQDEIDQGGGLDSFDNSYIEEMASLSDVDEKWHNCLVWGDESGEELNLTELFNEL